MQWAELDPDHIKLIASNVRPEDELEVGLSHHISGYDAVWESSLNSQICKVILGDNYTPVGVTGVWDDRIWLLGTPGLMSTASHRWQLAVHGRQWVQHCLDTVGKPIGNHAYAANTRSLRWLQHLGFTLEPPAPFGPSCALFCEFWRKS